MKFGEKAKEALQKAGIIALIIFACFFVAFASSVIHWAMQTYP